MKLLLIITLLLSTCQAQKVDDKFIDAYVVEFNKILPTRLNKYTIIGSTRRDGDSLIFIMETSLKINQKGIDKRKLIFDNEWCEEDIMKNSILKSGYTIVMDIRDKNHFKLGTNKTTYKDCQKNEAMRN